MLVVYEEYYVTRVLVGLLRGHVAYEMYVSQMIFISWFTMHWMWNQCSLSGQRQSNVAIYNPQGYWLIV